MLFSVGLNRQNVAITANQFYGECVKMMVYCIHIIIIFHKTQAEIWILAKKTKKQTRFTPHAIIKLTVYNPWL